MTNSLPLTGVLHQINWHGTSPYGVPFAVVSIIDAANNLHRALACSRRFGDLSRLSEFEGLRVNLVATPNGLQLKPIADQIPPEQQLEEDGRLEAMHEHGDAPVDAANQIHVFGNLARCCRSDSGDDSPEQAAGGGSDRGQAGPGSAAPYMRVDPPSIGPAEPAHRVCPRHQAGAFCCRGPACVSQAAPAGTS